MFAHFLIGDENGSQDAFRSRDDFKNIAGCSRSLTRTEALLTNQSVNKISIDITKDFQHDQKETVDYISADDSDCNDESELVK